MILDLYTDTRFCKALSSWVLSSGVKVLGVLIGALVFKKVGERLLKKGIEEAFEPGGRVVKRNGKRKETLYGVLSSLFSTLVWAFALLLILPEFGINTQALLAGVGVLGLAVGMASKEVVGDYVSGLFILFSGQYGAGDKVVIGGKEGEVVNINLRRTILRDNEGDLHFVPHHKVDITTRKKDGSS